MGIRINHAKHAFLPQKHSPLENQHRRPSSIAEQAMRKLDVSNSNYIRTEHYQLQQPPFMGSSSSRYHGSFITPNSPRPGEQSVLFIRDTKIAEPAPMPPIHNHYLRYNLPGRHPGNHMGFYRDRSADYAQYDSLIGIPLRETAITPALGDAYSGSIPHRTASNRLLSHGLDQRIMKQSTEDCRRLLQQVTQIFKSGRISNLNVIASMLYVL